MPTGPNPFIYDTNTLIQVVPNLKTAQSFLLDKFFPFVVIADSELVTIDVDVGTRRMSPFVSPLVEGKLVEQRRYQSNTYKPAYIKDKRAPDLRKPIRRMIGERIGGDSSAPERAMANLQDQLQDQIDILTRRLEWMAAQAMLTATVTIAGDGFPTALIDFGRDPSLTIALTGAASWGYTAGFNTDGRDPVPAVSIEAWQRQILKTSGASATDIIFTSTPWIKFLQAEGVQGAIYYPRLGDYANTVNPGAQITKGAVYKGRWGQYDLWLYNDWYVEDGTNIQKPMIPDGTVLMSGPDLMGVRAFGVIMDPAFNYESMPFAPKTWIEQDPPQQLMMMQSAPIVVPARVNACVAATVCPGLFN